MTNLSWGGDRDGETVLDPMEKIQKKVPSAVFTLIEAYPKHSGGWPIFEINFSESEIELMAEAFEMSVEDFVESYFDEGE